MRLRPRLAAWCAGLLACCAAHPGEDAAERGVFAALDGVDADDVAAIAPALAARHFTHDRVEALLREAGLLGAEDSFLKPNKPMLLHDWWAGDARRRPAAADALQWRAQQQPLGPLVVLFLLRGAMPAHTLLEVLGKPAVAALLQLGVLYSAGGGADGAPQFASSVQLFPLRSPAASSRAREDVYIATDWHRARPEAEAQSAVMTLGSDSQALAAWLRTARCPNTETAASADSVVRWEEKGWLERHRREELKRLEASIAEKTSALQLLGDTRSAQLKDDLALAEAQRDSVKLMLETDAAAAAAAPAEPEAASEAPAANATSMRVLDLCTGSGVQAVVAGLRCPGSQLTLVDRSDRALRFAAFNLRLNNISSDRTTLLRGDLYTALDRAPSAEQFDLITANPPFVPNPGRAAGVANTAGALFADGGRRGDDVLRRIVQGAADRLRDGGELRAVSSLLNAPLQVPSASSLTIKARVEARSKGPAPGYFAGLLRQWENAPGAGTAAVDDWRGEVVWRTVLNASAYAEYYEGSGASEAAAAAAYAEGLQSAGIESVAVDGMLRLWRPNANATESAVQAGGEARGAGGKAESDQDPLYTAEGESDEQELCEVDDARKTGHVRSGPCVGCGCKADEEQAEASEPAGAENSQPVLLWELAASGKWPVDLRAAHDASSC